MHACILWYSTSNKINIACFAFGNLAHFLHNIAVVQLMTSTLCWWARLRHPSNAVHAKHPFILDNFLSIAFLHTHLWISCIKVINYTEVVIQCLQLLILIEFLFVLFIELHVCVADWWNTHPSWKWLQYLLYSNKEYESFSIFDLISVCMEIASSGLSLE